jgi:hypothetical protein
MNDVVTLKSLSALAIEHEADFEVFHGETTHKDKRVRAQMILSLSGCPEVRVSFGDAAHGQRISSITLANNPKITVKQEHLLTVLENHRTNADWRRVMMNRETPLFNIFPADNNLVSLTGNIVRRFSRETAISSGKTETWDEFEVRIANYVMDARYLNLSASDKTELFETDPTLLYVKASYDENPELRDAWEKGLREAEIVGEYIFPNRIKFHRFKSNPSDYFSSK